MSMSFIDCLNSKAMLKKMGSILPKKIDDEIKDSENSEKIKKIYKLIKDNIDNEVWDMTDFKTFRGNIGSMTELYFERAYSFLIKMVKMNKVELYDYCIELNDKFNMNLLTEDTTCLDAIKLSGDVLKSLQSKMSQNASIITIIYHQRNMNLKDTEEEIEDFKTIYELLKDNDPDVISLIDNYYNQFLSLADGDSELRELLYEDLDVIVEENKKIVFSKIKRHALRCENHTSFDQYKNDRISKYLHRTRYM